MFTLKCFIFIFRYFHRTENLTSFLSSYQKRNADLRALVLTTKNFLLSKMTLRAHRLFSYTKCNIRIGPDTVNGSLQRWNHYELRTYQTSDIVIWVLCIRYLYILCISVPTLKFARWIFPIILYIQQLKRPQVDPW